MNKAFHHPDRHREIAVADAGLFCDFPQSWRYLPRGPRHA